MSRPDLNLLVTLDVLLEEGSVARAAERLGLSPSAMSRALARLRRTTGDPLLVRAGRGLVPTPRALALRSEVGPLVEAAEAALRPAAALDPATLTGTFSLRASEGFVEKFGPALVTRVADEAPGVRLRFVPKPNRDSAPLREGAVDLEVGVLGRHLGPELRSRALFHDRFVGVVRPGHPLCGRRLTAAGYAASPHVVVARRGGGGGPVDVALAQLSLAREVAITVGGFSAALALARALDLVATVPQRHTAGLRDGLHTFALPFPVPELTISLLWHPRLDADPAQGWWRGCVLGVCGGGE